VCCHFSTDGKLLASAGHEKKVKHFKHGNIVDIFSCSKLLAIFVWFK
jgi:hypothetical protein